jgi:hypothetical protein
MLLQVMVSPRARLYNSTTPLNLNLKRRTTDQDNLASPSMLFYFNCDSASHQVSLSRNFPMGGLLLQSRETNASNSKVRRKLPAVVQLPLRNQNGPQKQSLLLQPLEYVPLTRNIPFLAARQLTQPREF